ncbi:MAG TPA: GAF domain-containing protein [Anaerolineaceae bacterium]
MTDQSEQLRRERQLRRLRRAGMLISSRSSLQDTLDAILQMALEIMDASYGIFRLVDPSGNYLVTRSFVGDGLAKPAVENLPINTSSIMGYVAVNREAVVISDLNQEPWKNIYYPFDHTTIMRSEVAVPLIGASGRLEGVLNLESPEVDAFSKEDRYILQILATQAVVAIQEVRLLDSLQDIASMLYTHPLQLIHQSLVERACDLLNVPACLIWLHDQQNLVVSAASDSSWINQAINIGRGPTSQAFLSGKPIAISKLGLEDCDLPSLNIYKGALLVPFLSGENLTPRGILSIYSSLDDPRDFNLSDWDRRVVNIFAHYASLAIQNKSHQQALKAAEDQRATTETFAAIGDIAANLLHRLNNKVGTIPVRIEGIQDKREKLLQSDPYLSTNLQEIQKSATETMQVVRESLDLLKPIQLAPVSVWTSVQNAINSVRLPSSVDIQLRGLAQLPAVQAGADGLSLVFSNLLENASDAMGGKGIITITGSTQSKWAVITIQDDGPGIPLHLQDRIFEFNYSTRSTHPGKLGFGLWWVKTWITRFGGRVTVESQSDKGSIFTLYLLLSNTVEKD